MRTDDALPLSVSERHFHAHLNALGQAGICPPALNPSPKSGDGAVSKNRAKVIVRGDGIAAAAKVLGMQSAAARAWSGARYRGVQA